MASETDGDLELHTQQHLPNLRGFARDPSSVSTPSISHSDTDRPTALRMGTTLENEATPTRIYVDQEVQVGEPWAEVLKKESYTEHLSKDQQFDHILLQIKGGGWSIGRFLAKLFTIPARGEPGQSPRHAAAVSSFLGGTGGPGGRYETVMPDTIVELMYSSRDSVPKSTDQEKNVEKGRRMAHHLLSEWAIQKVEGYVDAASTHVSSKEGGFHLTREQTTWKFIHGFSLANAIQPIELKSAVLLQILAAAALPAALRDKFRHSPENPSPYSTYLSRSIPPGSGGNRKNSLVIIVITFLMLMYARNLHFSVFRKIAGIWLFANNASASIFSVLSQIGLSASYTTVLKTLHALSLSAQSLIREKVRLRAFVLIYDNIN
ncbi:hypothetical protein K438DRAFT_1979722 [Mycena galopus ATCC 62051]|nr:hypothetical protein K438DRAFT_1979722 [Mycena galopus ATCC 62051]